MKMFSSKKNKKTIVLIILLLVISAVAPFSYAKYTSEVKSSDQVRVAKAGELTLIEKINGEVQINNSDVISNISYDITSDSVIDKEVYIEFIDSEVSTYLFLVIDSINWSYNDDLRKMYVMNNNASLITFDIDETWSFLDEASSDYKFVFYHLVDVNENNDNNKYDVMNQINIEMITTKDESKINNSSLRFSAYSIQKNDDTSVAEAWNYLNLE